ncbi:unnamed protein product [marine sediment metagenome]|uniref:Uncharacterized protein n=1 Tax=marine sediment metagenome TaxID=412755 RepID=X1IYW9_9ZZZZ
MAKVKICLDSACTKYIYCDDGTTVIQKKPECDTSFKPSKEFDKDFDLISRGTTKTLFSPDEVFENPEIGKELVMKKSKPPEPPTKKQKIADLKKQIKELESGT